MNDPNRKASATAIVIARAPGTKNAWLNTYLPIWVVPVSSRSTAAGRIGGEVVHGPDRVNAEVGITRNVLRPQQVFSTRTSSMANNVNQRSCMTKYILDEEASERLPMGVVHEVDDRPRSPSEWLAAKRRLNAIKDPLTRIIIELHRDCGSGEGEF